MKKKLLWLGFLGAGMLLFSSCKVNWFDRTYDVPWWVIAIPVVLILVVAHVYVVTKTYRCPKCKTVFRPKWCSCSAWIHYLGDRLTKCPKCGFRGFCKQIGGGEEDDG